MRYSLYQQPISLPSTLNNCNNILRATFARLQPDPGVCQRLNGIRPRNVDQRSRAVCCSDGEASLPVRKELANGRTLTSAVGYTLNYNTLDNNKNPTDGLLIDFRQDFAGVGGDVTYLKTAIDAQVLPPLVSDIVGLIHVQGGILTKIGNNDIRMLDHFQMGPNLVRGFAPNGIGPRDHQSRSGTRRRAGRHQILGRIGRVADAVLVPAEGSRPEGRGLCRCRRPVGLQGPDVLALTGEINVPGLRQDGNPRTAGTCTGLSYDDSNVVRTSVGVGLIWASPFGPLRFDYAVPITKGAVRRRAGVQVRRRDISTF